MGHNLRFVSLAFGVLYFLCKHTLSWLSLPFNCLHSPYLVIFLILISTFSSQNFIFLLFWLIHPVSLLGPIYRPKWRIPWTWKASSGPAHLQSLYMRYAFVLNISGWAGPLSKIYSPRMCPFNYKNHVHWSNVPKNDSICPVQRRSGSFGPGPWAPFNSQGHRRSFLLTLFVHWWKGICKHFE